MARNNAFERASHFAAVESKEDDLERKVVKWNSHLRLTYTHTHRQTHAHEFGLRSRTPFGYIRSITQQQWRQR